MRRGGGGALGASAVPCSEPSGGRRLEKSNDSGVRGKGRGNEVVKGKAEPWTASFLSSPLCAPPFKFLTCPSISSYEHNLT